MVTTFETTGPFHGPEVRDIFDNAQLAGCTRWIGADIAEVCGADIATALAFAGCCRHSLQRIREGQEQKIAPLDQLEHGSAG